MEKEHIMNAVKKILAVTACAVLAALLANCATVNRLDNCDFEGATWPPTCRPLPSRGWTSTTT